MNTKQDIKQTGQSFYNQLTTFTREHRTFHLKRLVVNILTVIILLWSYTSTINVNPGKVYGSMLPSA